MKTLQALRIILGLTSIVAAGPAGSADEPRATSLPVHYSGLWGRSGELWSPQSRLPDFSFAGYHFGNDPIPEIPINANVKDFGARGDGTSDDTEAFLKAIASVSNGTVFIPAGRYRITQVLKLTRSNLVLRGAGRDATVLCFPKSLTEMVGPAPEWAGSKTAQERWSWGGGVIWCQGKDTGTKQTVVTVPSKRGDRTLTLSSTQGITACMTIRLIQHDPPDDSLGLHLHADYSRAGVHLLKKLKGKLVDWISKVTVVSGNQVTLDRPLRVDVRLEWSPEIFSSRPSVQEIGLEDFTIEFPDSPYDGHFTEKGFNGIYFDDVHHSWVRNVTILDSDNGILCTPTDQLGISRNLTISGLRLANQWRAKAVNGHHGIALEGPQDCLITDFVVDSQFIHDLTVDTVCCGNVFSKGRGRNLCLDHHTLAPYENLFTEIDAGIGDRLWASGGPGDGGPGSAARETLWNIRATSPPAEVAPHPQLNIVGMKAWPTLKFGMSNEDFFKEFGGDLLVLNGLDYSVNNHEPGSRYMATGKLDSLAYPTFAALVAACKGPECPLGFLRFGGYSNTGNLIPMSRVPYASALQKLANADHMSG